MPKASRNPERDQMIYFLAHPANGSRGMPGKLIAERFNLSYVSIRRIIWREGQRQKNITGVQVMRVINGQKIYCVV